MEGVLDLLLFPYFYIGPIILVLLNWRFFIGPVQAVPKSIIIVLSFTVIHWVGLFWIGVHQWFAGCPTFLGECYSMSYWLMVDLLKTLIMLSSWVINIVSLILIASYVIRHLRKDKSLDAPRSS